MRAPDRPLIVRLDGRAYEVSTDARGRVFVVGRSTPLTVVPGWDPSTCLVEIDDRQVCILLKDDGATIWAFADGYAFEAELERPTARRRGVSSHEEVLSTPMPATVLRVLVAPGQRVEAGQTLVLLEAMKMELPVRAPRDGLVLRVHCRPAEMVEPGAALIELEEQTV